MKGLVRNKKTRNPLLNAKPAKVTWTSPKQTSVLKTHWSTEKGANSKLDGNAIFRQERTTAELIQNQYNALDQAIQQLFDSEKGSDKYNESVHAIPPLLQELKTLEPNGKDFIFRRSGLEGLSGDRLENVEKIKNALDKTLETDLANKLFEPDPKFKRLLDEVLDGNQAFYYFPIKNGNIGSWEYKEISKEELIQKFIQSWKASVLKDTELTTTKEWKEYDNENEIFIPKKNGLRSLLPRHIKKTVDMGILELLKEFRSWDLNPIPFLALLPNIQFGHGDGDKTTGLEQYKDPDAKETAFTIPPGTKQKGTLMAWPYFRMVFKGGGGGKDIASIFRMLNNYSPYFYSERDYSDIRNLREESKKNFKILEEAIFDRRSTEQINEIINNIEFDKIRLVKVSDFYKEPTDINLEIRSRGTGGYLKSKQFTTIQYKISPLKDGVITVIHELLHAFSLSGCNAANRKKTSFTEKEVFQEEAFVHLLDRVVEVIAIMSRMEKMKPKTEEEEKDHKNAMESLKYRLCYCYEATKRIYMPQIVIKSCLDLLDIPSRVHVLKEY